LYVLWFALLLTMVRVYMKTLRFHTFGKGNPAASCGEFWGLNMLCVKTQKNSYLVQINKYYWCYVDQEGNFLRSVEDINNEIKWAKETWKNFEEDDLIKTLSYVGAYKNSLVEV
jgi:hypothetical protein